MGGRAGCTRRHPQQCTDIGIVEGVPVSRQTRTQRFKHGCLAGGHHLQPDQITLKRERRNDVPEDAQFSDTPPFGWTTTVDIPKGELIRVNNVRTEPETDVESTEAEAKAEQ